MTFPHTRHRRGLLAVGAAGLLLAAAVALGSASDASRAAIHELGET